jgi:hypothetical protein
MKEPSTAWREATPADEAQLFERVTKVVGELQRAKSARFGPGRAFHRKPLMALAGTLDVLPGLPAHASHGLFATPGRHRALVRLSSGGPDVQSNRLPDIRGFALKVLDVAGPGALGGQIGGQTDHQDFLMVNHDALPFASLGAFTDIAQAMTAGQASLVAHFFRKFGLVEGWRQLTAVLGTLGRKFGSFATERFNTVAAHACGPYAVRVRLKPAGTPPTRRFGVDIVRDLRQRLAKGPLAWDLELQFFVDEATTPIEDITKAWPDSGPAVTVARLTLEGEAPGDVEAMRFDPWSGLLAHRPLGEVMRARKVAYLVSQKGRGAA